MSAVRIGRPGEPVRLIPEHVPALTQRQAQVLHWVRAYGGSRSAAARHLGLTVAAVQKALRYCEQAGANVPPGITRLGIPNAVPRPLTARCERTVSGGPCGRRLDHPGFCFSERAWFRKRTVEPLHSR